jgi:hypothetical protein
MVYYLYFNSNEENFKKNKINNLASARSASILIIDYEAYLNYI